jgi:CheY-like chemotaxis protein
MSKNFVLLVEDNYNDELLTRRAFGKNKIADHLVVVRDGEQAIDFLRGAAANSSPEAENSNVPSLILLDLKLPKLDGLAVLKRIRENEATRNVPVVVLTSSDEEIDIRKSYDLGVNSFIRKPVDFNEFVETIHQLGLYWLKLGGTLS